MDARDRIGTLQDQLQQVMQADAAWARHVLGGAARRLDAGKDAADLVAAVSDRLEASARRYRARLASLPSPSYPEDLPITAYREQILEALERHPVLVVAGETGSGKTTQLPKFCLEAGRGTRGLIGCTQPRRIAARAMAERVAEELECRLGSTIGYQVRFRDHSSPDSLVKFMTDGILLAESQGDALLNAYDTLIIDEAHERSLNIDFLLGHLRHVVASRPDLRLIITSATIDTAKFAAHFGDAPVIEVSGRGYPVDILYRPLDEAAEGRGGRDLYRAIGEAVNTVSRRDPHGDILVFLSGEREIHEAAASLARLKLRHTEVLPLYSRLSAADQQKVFHPGTARRIILSTNVAETSLTVPRIRFVIDAGQARISRYAHHSRIQRLPIEPVSQASANQRAGRCGRLGPGTCVRLYSEADFDARPEFTEPEILRTSLATVILRMLSMGLGSVEAFPFIDPPAPRMINDGYALLLELGAIDASRTLTELGYRLARWPLDARLARMVIEGDRLGCLDALIVLAAGLSIQDPRERPLDQQAQADEAHARFADPQSDFVAMLKLWSHLEREREARSGSQFRKQCGREFLNVQRVLEWFDLVAQLREQAREEGMELAATEPGFEAIHKALLSGHLTHVGQRHPEKPFYIGVRNRHFSIFPGSGLFGRNPAWLMSAEVVETSKPYARTNAQVKPEWIEQQGRHLLKYHVFEPHWSRRQGQVMAYQQVSLYGLVLVERRRCAYAAHDPEDARRVFIREALAPGDFAKSYPFAEHNRRLRETLETIEHKRRLHDVLVDDAHLAALLGPRVPAGVCSIRSLEAWLAQTGDRDGESLKLTRADLLRDAAGDAPADRYPDALQCGGHRVPLSYRFAPGEADDGITLELPLEWLNTLDAAQLEWLVPGHVMDKAEALVRTLPKPRRRALTPIGDRLEKALRRYRDSGLSLREALARGLSVPGEPPLQASDFDPAAIPDFLHFRFRLMGDGGREVASSRDLDALVAQHGPAARRRFMDRQGRDWNVDGARDWQFGELPRQCVTERGATAFPALTDQGDAVGLRLFDTADEAAWSHIEGLRRLAGIALRDKFDWMRRQHGIAASRLAAFTSRGSVAALIEDLAWSTLAQQSDAAALAVRDAGAFAGHVSKLRAGLGTAFRERARLLDTLLEALAALAGRLGELEDRFPDPVGDVRAVLDDLLYEGFLVELAPQRLSDLPRYLEALRLRLQRLEENPSRDAALVSRLGDYWQRYVARLAAGGDYDEALDAYRWLCHEFRVSLFAQQLGTGVKVSAKRLDEAWRSVLSRA